MFQWFHLPFHIVCSRVWYGELKSALLCSSMPLRMTIMPCLVWFRYLKIVCSVQLLSRVRLCDHMDCSMPGLPVHHQSQSLLKLMSFESVMPSNHIILCCPLLLQPSIFPSIRVFSSESSSSHHVAKVLEFQLQHQSFQCIFRTDFL